MPLIITTPILDVQSFEDHRLLAVNRVGIKAIKHPIAVQNSQNVFIPSIGTFDMFVYLPHHLKGTHMSRFVEILNQKQIIISAKDFVALLFEVQQKLDTNEAYIGISFTYFKEKSAPISGAKSLLDYEVKIQGVVHNDKATLEITVVVPVTTLCPCSRDISEFGAHNQRSHVTLTWEPKALNTLALDDMIALVESEASCELFSILKRPDEKYVTERAYNNPKFVEDIVRDIANKLLDEENVVAFKVESENFESIHNHSAYAMIEIKK